MLVEQNNLDHFFFSRFLLDYGLCMSSQPPRTPRHDPGNLAVSQSCSSGSRVASRQSVEARQDERDAKRTTNRDESEEGLQDRVRAKVGAPLAEFLLGLDHAGLEAMSQP